MRHNLDMKGFKQDESPAEEQEIRKLIERKMPSLNKRVEASAPDDEIFLRVLVEQSPPNKAYHLSVTLDLPGKTLAAKEAGINIGSVISAVFSEVERQFDTYRASRRGELEWKRIARRKGTSTTKGCVLLPYTRSGTRNLVATAAVLSLTVGTISAEASAQGSPQEKPTSNVSSSVRIPIRPDKPLFQSQQGKQKTEIHYDRATGIVTLKLLVQDPNGYFIPNIRRGNFAVYENGVRQQDVGVGVEHAPVSLALLMEHGGHYPGLNKAFCEEVSRTAQQALDALGPEDKLAIWTYGDMMKEVLDFSQDHQLIDNALFELRPPGVSEINLYDALISASERMRRVAGRKAVLLISSGVDTFSKATYEDAVKAVRDSNTPIYVISMLPTLRNEIETLGPAEAMKAIDSTPTEKELTAFAQASGGRFYVPENTLDLSGMYDDIIENLKVRYVLTYKSSIHTDTSSPRNVRVELVNPSAGGPLQIVDTNGRTVRAKVIIQDSYTP